MPRKPSDLEKMDKWNFYLPELLKVEYIKALVENGHMRAQSAGLRALMELYTTDKELQEKVKPLIEKHLIYKQNGDPSLL